MRDRTSRATGPARHRLTVDESPGDVGQIEISVNSATGTADADGVEHDVVGADVDLVGDVLRRPDLAQVHVQGVGVTRTTLKRRRDDQASSRRQGDKSLARRSRHFNGPATEGGLAPRLHRPDQAGVHWRATAVGLDQQLEARGNLRAIAPGVADHLTADDGLDEVQLNELLRALGRIVLRDNRRRLKGAGRIGERLHTRRAAIHVDDIEIIARHIEV